MEPEGTGMSERPIDEVAEAPDTLEMLETAESPREWPLTKEGGSRKTLERTRRRFKPPREMGVVCDVVGREPGPGEWLEMVL